ncbi:hypothetical protein C6501_09720 [Candidatus Poribacteria bacterium]|nr:MAG: hypothetical protein C6501_09720 [Candidatus Poribacteria bacterium]
MELNLQLTTQAKILIGVLVVVLIAAVATQWGPGLYGLISNPDMEIKRQTLQTSKDLVAASKILKPIEVDLYQKTGLTEKDKTATIFEESYPQSVIREKIHTIVKEAGIPQNYQLDMDPVPGKKSEKISPQARRNLVVYLYQKKLKTERDTLTAEIEADLQAQDKADLQAEIEEEQASMDMLMDAWLDETDVDVEEPKASEKSNEKQEDAEEPADVKTDVDVEEPKASEKSNEKQEDAEEPADAKNHEKPQESNEIQTETENSVDTNSQWGFASFPKTIPSSIQVELIELIISMTEQHLVGAEKTLFENQFDKTQTTATSGFLGIGAKEPKTEIYFRPNSQILAAFTELIDTYGEEGLNKDALTQELLEYLAQIQSQIEELAQKLTKAPASYLPESYNIKMKFKAEIDKLVNLNRLIETKTKWLMVRDLQISADNKDNKINIDVLMIARVYQ